MIKKLFAALLLFCLPVVGLAQGVPSCPLTTGVIQIHVNQPRISGISPFLAFFDATATTTTAALGGAGTVIQDVHFSWTFGDAGSSGGSATWSNGASGQTLRNVGHGPVAAHLYVLPINATSDVTSTVKVQAKVVDNVTHVETVAACTVTVTTFAPSGTNGFPNTSTVCAFNSAVGTGCPAGANTVTAGTASAAIASLNACTSGVACNKRVLLKCGDTFSGGMTIPVGLTTASIGAYGSCVGTVSGNASGRPIITSTGDGLTLNNGGNTGGVSGNQTDVRVADIEVSANVGNSSFLQNSNGSTKLLQLTYFNIYGHGFADGFFLGGNPQSGVISSYIFNITGVGGGGAQAFYFNSVGFSSNNICYLNGGVCDVRYGAILGNYVDMGPTQDTVGNGSEVLRISACQFCIITNNTLKNANQSGATLKMLAAGSTGTFPGQYSQYNEISDNLFTGKTGTVIVALAPTNTNDDERFRFTIFERNFIQGGPCPCNPTVHVGATKVWFTGQNMTARNNVWFIPASDTYTSDHQLFINTATSLQNTSFPTQGIEAYNNTCYALSQVGDCVGFAGGDESTGQPGNNSFAQNNLFYNNGATGTPVVNNGTGNTVTPNSNCASANCYNMKNGSGNFSRLGDYVPQANATGATSTIPNYFDCSQLSWTAVYQHGACSQGAPP